MDTPVATNEKLEPTLSLRDRIVALVTTLLGWTLAGTIMVIIPLAGRAATASFLGPGEEGLIGDWFSRYICAFLLGAAAGGLLFGWLGDRVGRARAMAASILCYSIITGLTYFVQSPEQLLVMRFLACLGVGGMWPNGVALVSEAWSNVSRPTLAGLIGASANLGFMLLSWMAGLEVFQITPTNWRWVMIVGACPVVVGVFAWFAVPESPRWQRRGKFPEAKGRSAVGEIFRPPLLKFTILGILLGAIPLMGNWGSSNWTTPWAGQYGGESQPELKASTQMSRSFGGTIGALLGGVVASRFGRRTTYFVISFVSLAISYHIFHHLQPGDPTFLRWVFGIGFFGTLYFGWLPLILPELFPTRVRATGSGVTFNFGRIATALAVLGTGQLMIAFDGDYARVGQITSLVYALGMVVVLVMPDTSQGQLAD